VRRSRAVTALAPALVALALILAACGGDDDEATTSPAPSVDARSGGATPPGAPGQLPQEFLDCVADQGFDIRSPDDIHSAPPQVLQACFGSLHSGGGTP
jgi:hypothetical protein